MAFNEEQNDYILELYRSSKKRPSVAIDLFKEKFKITVVKSTIDKKWNEAGFKRNSHGGKRYGLSKNEFWDLYNWAKGDLRFISKETGYRTGSLGEMRGRHIPQESMD